MLNPFLGETQELSSTLNLAVNTAAIGSISIAAVAFAPQLSKILKNRINFSLEREADDKSSQPLQKIFYAYDHRDVYDWLNWILSQDQNTKDLAFQMLCDYLSGPMEGLGVITEDAIKAVVDFKYPNSFATLLQLIQRSRDYCGQLKSIDLFYTSSAKGLIKLNEDNGFKTLKEEFIKFSNKEGCDSFKIFIIKALSEIKNPKVEVLDFLIRELINNNNAFAVREEIAEFIDHIENDLEQAAVYIDIFKSILESHSLRFNDNDQKILELAFVNIKKHINKGNKDIWPLLIQLYQKDNCKDLFSKLISELIKYPDLELDKESLLQTFSLADSAIKDALISRSSLSNSELTLITEKIKTEDLIFNKSTIVVEKSKKTKTVAKELQSEYATLERIVENTQLNNKDGLLIIRTICGGSPAEKIYLVRSLAANLDKSFIYVDFEKTIFSVNHTNDLKDKIRGHRPCLIYLDGIDTAITADLNRETLNNLKRLIQILKDESSSPSVKIIANIDLSKKEVEDNLRLSEKLANHHRINYEIVTDIGTLNDQQKLDLIAENINKLNPSRLNNDFNENELINAINEMTKVQCLKYLSQYFCISLLIYGKLISMTNFESDLSFLAEYQKTIETKEEFASAE